jgi:lipid II:glycine glycyltransferase (peptidoglycan interpeptide bridge formation enzyme)
VGADSPFWSGLREFCRHHRITMLQIDTFGSPAGAEIPAFGSHCTRRPRCEFVLDLAGDLPAMLGSNHKRNVKKAQKAGLVVSRTRSAEAASVHRALMSQSMDRRRSRGESVERIGPSLEDMTLLQSGAGELFQALDGSTVRSSVLVLVAPKGGYYQSAGTSPEGMAVGASHFLIHGIASQLSAVGARVFNLGGADEASSLARFKQGFGASPVHLPSASCYVGPSWRRRVTRGMALLRTGRKTMLRWLTGRMRRPPADAADTGAAPSPE